MKTLCKANFVVLLILFISSFAFGSKSMKRDTIEQDFIPKTGIAFSAGWGAPYGFGIEINQYITPNFEINAGLGVNFSGFHVGGGPRYFFKGAGSSPYLGLNYIHATGIAELPLNQDTETEANFKIPTNDAIFLRSGYRFDLLNTGVFLILNGGYGIPLKEKKAKYLNGYYDEDLQRVANVFNLGGVEISASILLCF